MRTLSATLSAAQKAAKVDALVRIVLTSGVNSYTYTGTRIMQIPSHPEAPDRQTAEVVLNNSDGVLTTLDLKGYKGVISYGITTSAGDEYSACAPLWVVGQQLHSYRGGLLCGLALAGTPNLLNEDKANADYTPTQLDVKTVKDLLTEIIKAVLPSRANSTAYVLDDLVIPATSNSYTYKCTTAGTSAGSAPTWPTTIGGTVTDGTVVWTNQGEELKVYSHATAYTPTFDSEDSLIDVYMPKDTFRIYEDGSRWEAIKRLLEYTKNVVRVPADGQIHIFVPTTTGTTYDYEYKLAVADEHTFFNKALRQRLVIPNYVVVKSHPDHSPSYTGFAEDAASSALLSKRKYNRYRLASNAQATAIAEAIIARLQLEAETGAASVPMNVGAEVYDYVKVTDSRQNDNRVGNLGHLNRRYQRGIFEMGFHFGKVDAGGLMGTAIMDTATVVSTSGAGAIDWTDFIMMMARAISQLTNAQQAQQQTILALVKYLQDQAIDLDTGGDDAARLLAWVGL